MSASPKPVQDFTISLKNMNIAEKHKEWVKHLNYLEDSVYKCPKIYLIFKIYLERY